jgi:hypothetical protein
LKDGTIVDKARRVCVPDGVPRVLATPNDQTFVDSYRTPHTDKLHVVERFRLVDGGNTLEVAFTVDDPGAFYQPWSGTRNRHRVNPNARPPEFDCPAFNDDYFNIGLEPVPTAQRQDF